MRTERHARGSRWIATSLAGLVLLATLAASPASARPRSPDGTGNPLAQGVAQTTGDADEDPPLLIVMDISTSMAEADASGGSRIDGAKAAVTDFIATLPDTTRVGLDTYPAAQCDGGSSPIPITSASLSEMDRYVRTLEAVGDGTPTGLALKKAGQDLQRAGGSRGVILLVSDGESNCGDVSPPPCDVAKELADSGIDITVNTVGFQISEVGRSELRCIAEATGGTYADVDDGGELADEITTYSTPELELTLDPADQTVVLQPGSTNDVAITATVRNVGSIEAPNVEATLVYDVEFSPGSAKPRHRLGNLQPGDTSTFTWQFRPTDEFTDQVVRYSAIASTRRFQTPRARGTVRFRRDTSTAGLPEWLRSARNIVVMGDSYSSGEGAGTADPDEGIAYDEPTDEPYNSCHRSRDHNYAGQLGALLDTKPTVHVLACSGARTSAFWMASDDVDPKGYHTADGRKRGAPLASQLDQFEDLDAEPDLVFLTVGGNDAGFKDIAIQCLSFLACDPPFPGVDSASEILAQGLESLPGNLATTYRSVARVAREKAGHEVPILVLAYPLPFPLDQDKACGNGTLLFPPWNRQFLNSTALQVNAVVEKQVEASRSQGVPVWFVERTAGAFQGGHTYCDDDPWINRITVEGVVATGADFFVGVAEYTFVKFRMIVQALTARAIRDRAALLGGRNLLHPTRDGYRAQAVQIITWATRNKTLEAPTPESIDPARPDVRAVRSKDSSGTIDLADRGTADLSPGSAWVVEAAGFAPGASVRITLESSPELLTTAYADERGRVAAGIWIRPEVPLGAHHLVAHGADADGERRVVRRPVEIKRELPGWWTPAAVANGALGVAAAACWFGWRRRRRAERRTQAPATLALT